MEDQLSSIEEQYQKAYNMFYCMQMGDTTQPSNATIELRQKYWNLKYVSEAVKSALDVQAKIELLYEDIKKLSDEKTKFYINRVCENVSDVIRHVSGTSALSGACELLDITKYNEAYAEFRKVRSSMYKVLEDVRLIYALRIYPIEEKMALKSALTNLGFLEVTTALDEAERNLAEKNSTS